MSGAVVFEPHECKPPNAESLAARSIWRCGECGSRWEVDSNGPWLYHHAWKMWERLDWFNAQGRDSESVLP